MESHRNPSAVGRPASRRGIAAVAVVGIGLGIVATLLSAGCRQSRTGGGGSAGTAVSNDLTWSKTYGGPGAERATAMVESPRGGYLVAGVTDDWDDGASEIWAFRVDGAGDSIWSRTYGESGLRLDEVRSVAWDPASGDLFLVGVEVVDEVREGVAIRLTPDLRVRWRRSLPIDEPEHVLPFPEGGAIISGATHEEGTATALRLDDDGRTVWEQTLGAGSAHVATIAPGARIYIGGVHREPGEGQPLVASLRFTGEVDWLTSLDVADEFAIVRGFDLAGASGNASALGTVERGAPEEGENTVFRLFITAAGELVNVHALPTSGEGIDGAIAWNWLERLGDGTYVATGASYEPGAAPRPIAGRYDFDFAELATYPLALPATETSGIGRRVVAKGPSRAVILGETTGASGNVLVVEVEGLDTIVASGITGALSGGTSGNDRVLGATFAQDGNLCLGGRTTAGPNGPGAWLTLLDPVYAEIAERFRDLDGVDDLAGAIPNRAGDGFILLGTASVTASGIADAPAILVIEIDGDGAVRWQRALRGDSGFSERGVAICAHGSGYSLIAQSGPGIVVIALDEAGAVVAETRHEPPPITDLRLTAGGIAARPGGDLFIAGTLDDPAAGEGDGVPQPIWVARLGPDLAQSWRVELLAPLPIGAGVVHPRFRVAGVAALESGCAVLAATTIFAEEKSGLVAVDGDGAPLWGRIYGGGPGDDEAAAVGRGPDDTLTIAVTTRTEGGGLRCDGTVLCPNIAALRVRTSDGTIDGQWTYSTATSDVAGAVGVSASGDFFLAGKTDGVLGNPDIWALRLAADGTVSPSCPSGIGVAAGFSAAVLEFVGSGVAATESAPTIGDLGPDVAAILREAFEETRQCTGEGTDPDPIEFTVAIAIVGQGSVATPGGVCTGDCDLVVAAGTVIELVATPAAGWSFAGWGGDYAGVPVEVTTDLSVTATFAEPCGSRLEEFDSGTWGEAWSAVEYGISGLAFTASSTQPNGGNPGAFRQTYFALVAGSAVSTAQFAPEFTVDPAAGSPLLSVDFAADIAQITALPPAALITIRCALRQGGTIYTAPSSQATLASTAWTPVSTSNLGAAEFVSSAGAHPDFSAAGGPIEIGFALSGSSPVAVNHLVGVDNLAFVADGVCP